MQVPGTDHYNVGIVYINHEPDEFFSRLSYYVFSNCI